MSSLFVFSPSSLSKFQWQSHVLKIKCRFIQTKWSVTRDQIRDLRNIPKVRGANPKSILGYESAYLIPNKTDCSLKQELG